VSNVLDVEIDVGATWTLGVTYKDAAGNPINLTGATAKLQVRDAPGGTVLLDLSSPSGGITITPLAGQIDVTASHTLTGAVTAEAGFYDLLLTLSGGSKVRLLRGRARFVRGVTV
jgi:hypothetical protein